jgi:hypothetical protein
MKIRSTNIEIRNKPKFQKEKFNTAGWRFPEVSKFEFGCTCEFRYRPARACAMLRALFLERIFYGV